MRKQFVLKTSAVYGNDALIEGLGVAKLTLEKARRSGQLRSTRKGHRLLYLGKWVIDWLNAGSRPSQPERTDDQAPVVPD